MAENEQGSGGTPEVDLQIEKIIEGSATVQKPSGWRKFRKSFIAGDATSVGEHIYRNLLIPALKDAASDMASTFVDMMIYGEKRNRFGPPGSSGVTVTGGAANTSRFNYGGLTSSSPIAAITPGPPELSRKVSPTEVTLQTRAEAEGVLTRMFGILDQYGSVSVGHMYGMLGLNAEYIDHKWGWKDLQSAHVKRVRKGVQLILPDPIDLQH